MSARDQMDKLSEREALMEDEIPGGHIARIGVIALLVTFLAVACAFALLRVSGGAAVGSPNAVPEAPAAIGMVEQTSIEDQRRGLAVREKDRDALDRLAWLDRDAGLAQRPIDEAIADIVKKYNDGGAP